MRASIVSEFGHWRTGKLRNLPAHRNAGLEIVLIVRGQATWQIEGRIEAVPPGSVFFTLPWETHGGVRQHEPGFDLFFVVFRLDRAYPKPSRSFGFHPSLHVSPALTNRLRRTLLAAPRRSWPATARLAMLMPEIIAELSSEKRNEEAVHALLKLALIELARSVRGLVHARQLPLATRRVEQFVERLTNECHHPWTLASMSEACELGRSRFTDILKKITGDSPMMALNRARIDRAQQLLTGTTWPITRIARECGYSSSQHFAGVFRAYAGCSARTYRKGQSEKSHRVANG